MTDFDAMRARHVEPLTAEELTDIRVIFDKHSYVEERATPFWLPVERLIVTAERAIQADDARRRLVEAAEIEAVYRSYSATIPTTGTLGRSRTRRNAIGTREAVVHLRRVIDEARAALAESESP